MCSSGTAITTTWQVSESKSPTVVRKYDMITISTPLTQCGPGGQSDEYHIPDHYDGQTHFWNLVGAPVAYFWLSCSALEIRSPCFFGPYVCHLGREVTEWAGWETIMWVDHHGQWDTFWKSTDGLNIMHWHLLRFDFSAKHRQGSTGHTWSHPPPTLSSPPPTHIIRRFIDNIHTQFIPSIFCPRYRYFITFNIKYWHKQIMWGGQNFS